MATDLPTLSERTRRVLAALVREHIETGEPVASQALVRSGLLRGRGRLTATGEGYHRALRGPNRADREHRRDVGPDGPSRHP